MKKTFLYLQRVKAVGTLVVASFFLNGCEKPAVSSVSSSPVATPSSDPVSPTATAKSTYEGFFEVADGASIAGWAWDSAVPDAALKLDIYDGKTRIATVTADNFREDLKTAGKGTGKYQYIFPVPESLKDGKEHSISVKFSGTDTSLIGSPKMMKSS